jgi:hypothetical protein
VLVPEAQGVAELVARTPAGCSLPVGLSSNELRSIRTLRAAPRLVGEEGAGQVLAADVDRPHVEHDVPLPAVQDASWFGRWTKLTSATCSQAWVAAAMSATTRS